MEPTFTLHPRLRADTTHITHLPVCDAVLMNNAHFPWMILIPRIAGARELHQLNPTHYQQVLHEVQQCAHSMEACFTPDKMNIATLGNQVPQLHIHIIARYMHDNAWPNPVWGNPSTAYTPQRQQEIITQLRPLLQRVIQA